MGWYNKNRDSFNVFVYKEKELGVKKWLKRV